MVLCVTSYLIDKQIPHSFNQIGYFYSTIIKRIALNINNILSMVQSLALYGSYSEE